jgi:hypothetical protein
LGDFLKKGNYTLKNDAHQGINPSLFAISIACVWRSTSIKTHTSNLFLKMTKFTAVTCLQFINIKNNKPLNNLKYALAFL